MIESFGDKETESVFNGIRSRKLPNDIQQRARRKLRMIDQAQDMPDLQVPPSNHLESLRGEFKGFWSIQVNDQWRIMFRWEKGIKRDVSIIGCH